MRVGTIIKGIGGFYYVRDEESGEVVCCRMRGSIRLLDITPAVGDKVNYSTGDDDNNVITEILARKSFITRPACANATQGVIVMAVKKPNINTMLLDKLLCDNEKRGLKSVVCINKCDLDDEGYADEIVREYSLSGIPVIKMCAKDDKDGGTDELKNYLKNTISVMRGVSGAGKTTIINKIAPDYISETGEVSRKTGRGKHTTRFSELIFISEDTYILDTPGFSSFTLEDIGKNEVWKYYKEFYEYSDCRFPNCNHINEPDCSVKEALNLGKISKLRYENYIMIVKEIEKKELFN